jgi:uncharacterized membrane protein
MNGHVLGLIIAASILLPFCVGAVGAILDSERMMDLSLNTILAAVVFWVLAGLVAATSFLVFGVELI